MRTQDRWTDRHRVTDKTKLTVEFRSFVDTPKNNWHVRGRGEVHTGFWWGDLREGDNLGDPGIDGRIIFKWIFKQ
jgi:hypothetical protein